MNVEPTGAIIPPLPSVGNTNTDIPPLENATEGEGNGNDVKSLGIPPLPGPVSATSWNYVTAPTDVDALD